MHEGPDSLLERGTRAGVVWIVAVRFSAFPNFKNISGMTQFMLLKSMPWTGGAWMFLWNPWELSARVRPDAAANGALCPPPLQHLAPGSPHQRLERALERMSFQKLRGMFKMCLVSTARWA